MLIKPLNERYTIKKDKLSCADRKNLLHTRMWQVFVFIFFLAIYHAASISLPV